MAQKAVAEPLQMKSPDRPSRVGWRRLNVRKAATVGFVLLALFVFLTIFADFIAPRNPLKTSTDTFQPPSWQFWFGTDDLGRDVFSGVVHGARNALVLGITVTLLSSIVALLIGSISGYAGGIIDDLLMRLTELFLIPPRFFLAVIVAAIFGASYLNLIIILSLTLWPLMARLVRAEVMSLKQRGFVEAARAIGATPARILLREILPNMLHLIVTNMTFKVGAVILIEAALEFLGLGDANRISWGYMLHSGQHLMRDAWWVVVFPTLAISLLLLSLNLIGDEMNRALNPRLRAGYARETL